MTHAPAARATGTVSSDEPPSARTTSFTMALPCRTPNIRGRVSAASNDGIMTEIILFLKSSHAGATLGGMDMPVGVKPRKGRGAATNDTGRFEAEKRVAFDDGWGTADEEPAPLSTTLSI